MKDFYGKELAEGDKVLYATGGSYSKRPSMREGLVTKIVGDTISVRPTKGKFGVLNRVKYVDLRSGKFVDPWNHRKVEAHVIHKVTMEKLTGNYHAEFIWASDYRSKVPNPNFVPTELRVSVPMQYHSYIKKIDLLGGDVSHFDGGDRVVKL